MEGMGQTVEPIAIQVDQTVVEPYLPPPCGPPVDADRSPVEDATRDQGIVDVGVGVTAHQFEGANLALGKDASCIRHLLVIGTMLASEDVAQDDVRAPERGIPGCGGIYPGADILAAHKECPKHPERL